MITRTATITAIALLATLTACKGGGGGTTGKEAGKTTLPVATRQSAEGIWFGKTGNKSPAFALIAPMTGGQQEFRFAQSSGDFNYTPRATGFVSTSQTAFTADDVKTGEVFSNRLEGNVVARSSLTARLALDRDSRPIDTFTMTYSSQYDSPGALSRIVGNYSDTSRKISGLPHYQPTATSALEVDANGTILRGKLPGCTITSGVIIERAKGIKNLYRITLTVKPDGGVGRCLIGNNPPGEVSLTGLAALVILPEDTMQSLIFTASTVDGRSLLAGSIPKQ